VRVHLATAAALLVLVLGTPTGALRLAAQDILPPARPGVPAPAPAPEPAPEEARSISSESALARGDYSVVVDLDQKRLSFVHGQRVLWDAPVGVGTGARLRSKEGTWTFSTLTGAWRVERKELDPIWHAPDWYFVENGLGVPAPDSPARRFPGSLGVAALYIGSDLAIHGSDHPETLGEAISHACIRLSNADALRLYQSTLIGTEVLIVGGGQADLRPARPARATAASPLDAEWRQMRAGLRALGTEQLLARTATQIESGDRGALGEAWPTTLSALLERGLAAEGDDTRALDYALLLALTAPEPHEAEYDATLAHAFEARPLAVLEALARLARPERDQVAARIVHTSLALYGGQASDPGAPWPSRRVLESALSAPEQRLGMVALRYAEQAARAAGIPASGER
jgi:lipoprotein-anchoring transpeptidase ErfK/SrfK